VHVLLIPIGSHGDVHPFVGLGQALLARGHRATLATNVHFEDLAKRVGLDFVAVGDEALFREVTEDPDLWHPVRGFRLVVKATLLAMRPIYELIASRYASDGTVVAAELTAYGARIAQEALGVPMVSVHNQPGVFRSATAVPAWPGYRMARRLPVWGRRLLYRVADATWVDPLLAPTINAFRAELGLPPVQRILNWWNSSLCNLCLFPDWFGAPQSDWPAQNIVTTGFPLFDEGGQHPPDPEVERFLTACAPPVVFTAGSEMRHAHEFFEAAVDACRRLGRRGMLLSRHPEQVPESLPAEVRHFGYIPFSRLFPRVAAVVHHGGVGTAALALEAGLPQLVMPMAHDQPDNAERLERLGVSRTFSRHHVHGAELARLLDELLTSPEVAARCREAADRMHQGDPLGDACRVIEALAPAPIAAS
jgi:UDP:flavonoid glycosyltransferase YjiC (YdhE family)